MVIKGLLKILKGLITPKIYPPSDGTSAVQITKADGTTAVVTVDTTNSGMTVAGNISAQNIGWQALTATTDFATTAPSTSTITMNADKTATVKAGHALKWKSSGTLYYGQVVSITASLLTVRGTAQGLTTSAGALTELYYSDNMILTPPFSVLMFREKFAETTTTTLVETKFGFKSGFKWELPMPGYLVSVKITTTQDDSAATTQPTVQVRRGSSNVFTSAVTIPDNTETVTGIIMDSAQYKFSYGDYLEISVTAASGGTPANDAKNLGLQFVFVRA